METWQTTAVDTLIGLIGAGTGGLVTHFWQQRRASDKALFLVLRGAFDRPAFKGPYLWHSDHRAFQEAIATTLKAVKTGRRFDRHGQEAADRIDGRYYGPFAIRDTDRRRAMQDVEDRLQRILHLSKEIAASPEKRNKGTIKQIDDDRGEVIRTLNRIWGGLKIPQMRLPIEIKLYQEAYDVDA
jgi:hypothetical protein